MRLLDSLNNAAARAVDAGRSQVLLHRVQEEHARWAADAKLGATYYTARPTSGISAGVPTHSAFVFTRRIQHGRYRGQLETAGGTASWGLWWELGPLTLAAQWTHADQRARDEELSASLGAGLQAAAWDRFTAQKVLDEAERLYPASVKLLQAA
ncbi:hypothetical protein ACFYUY_01440 [Kitasatospora sp. NPDC004745]|uniref:hypothetical protein n=1 Tax=Kitasatospora sp. NPDC004745 TaxID=3364019 RepID=UPI0036803E6A